MMVNIEAPVAKVNADTILSPFLVQFPRVWYIIFQ